MLLYLIPPDDAEGYSHGVSYFYSAKRDQGCQAFRRTLLRYVRLMSMSWQFFLSSVCLAVTSVDLTQRVELFIIFAREVTCHYGHVNRFCYLLTTYCCQAQHGNVRLSHLLMSLFDRMSRGSRRAGVRGGGDADERVCSRSGTNK